MNPPSALPSPKESGERRAARPADLVAALRERGTANLTGASGAARGWLARELLGPGRTRLLLAVTADEEAADDLARDLAFFLSGRAGEPSPVLRLPADPVLPYDDLSPDRGLEMERLSALGRLHLSPASVRALVVSARALSRRTVPRAVFEAHADLLGVGVTLDREAFARKLVALGYARVPLVEDPGTFAVRGGIIDLWSPAEARPVRFELFGDEVESARFFDPESQRGDAAAASGAADGPAAPAKMDVEVTLVPAREAIFTPEAREAAKQAVREAAERVNRPTSRVREVLDAIDEAAPFLGLEALLPGFHPGGLSSLFDWLPEGTAVWEDGPTGIEEALRELQDELRREHEGAVRREELALPPEAHYLAPEEVEAALAGRPRVRRHGVWLGTEEPLRFELGDTSGLRGEIEGAHGEEGALAPLAKRLAGWRQAGLAAVVACASRSAVDRLRRLLEDRRLPARFHEGPLRDPAALYDPSFHAHLLLGEISSGFVDVAGRLALLSDEEIFGRRVRKKARAARLENAFAAAFRDLDEGDLVVHVEHGIARYLGLRKMQIRGIEGDFLVLAYEGQDRLYLPVSKLNQVQKFTGAEPGSVRLDRLGGSSFALRKARVKEQLLKMAGELLALYAARTAHPGFTFREPDEIYREFEAEFPYEPTPDQQKAIDEVVADMTGGRSHEARPSLAASAAQLTPARQEGVKPPMDRLVCGDVGYGKTEVALRAAMLAVLSRKQVAVLVPTTVLASQHERTFRERFKGYPVRIAALSRLQEADEVREVLRELAAGRIDIVVGTHRLLAADVSFKDLGLIVVDEEQRFGVAHKERLKKLRKLVDVLTLTATPIPRTLHMSLAGARDLSIIATPPEDRRAIRTFVVKFDPSAVKEAVESELRRGGQVFFVHNRVRSIAAMEKFLHELVPKARVGVAHGQMGHVKLEEVMRRFVAKELDVLLATSIIESGLDIPSANTIIVNRADHFGLAQLYQIRGRVGRSRERAYAYLLVPARRPVTKDAQKRLEVLQRFSELGAGFKIASHDLEIRGAGNLLGKDQSGHIEAIGFDLYAELLDEAVRELRGEAPKAEEVDPDVQLPLPAFIPDPYMPDVHQRLFFYKRFAQASSDEELDENPRRDRRPVRRPARRGGRAAAARRPEGAPARAPHPRPGGLARAGGAHARRQRRARPFPAREARPVVRRRPATHPRDEARGARLARRAPRAARTDREIRPEAGRARHLARPGARGPHRGGEGRGGEGARPGALRAGRPPARREPGSGGGGGAGAPRRGARAPRRPPEAGGVRSFRWSGPPASRRQSVRGRVSPSLAFSRFAHMRSPLFSLAALLSLALVAAPSSAAEEAKPGRVVNRVAGIVNGDVVTLRDLEERAQPDLARAEALPAGKERESARAAALRSAFDAVVAEKLFASQVKELGVEVSEPEVDAVVAEVKSRNALDDASLDRALAAQGMDRAAYRKAVKRDLESMRLVQLKIKSKLKVSDEDVRNYWQTHPQEFRTGEEVRVRHIFLALSEKADPAEAARVKALAEDLVRRIRAGEDFGKLARVHSEGPSAPEGGELGWLARGTVQPDVEKVAFALSPGEVAEPLRTPSGYQILELEERRGGKPRPLEEVKEAVRDRLMNEQGDAFRAQYVADLRKDAVIETRLPELASR